MPQSKRQDIYNIRGKKNQTALGLQMYFIATYWFRGVIMKKPLYLIPILLILLSGIGYGQDYVKLKALNRAMKCTTIDANDSLVVFQKSNSNQILQALISDVDWYFYADGSGVNFSGREITQSDFDNAYEYKPVPRKPVEIIKTFPEKAKSKRHAPINQKSRRKNQHWNESQEIFLCLWTQHRRIRHHIFK